LGRRVRGASSHMGQVRRRRVWMTGREGRMRPLVRSEVELIKRFRRQTRRVRRREAASGCCSWDVGEVSGVVWGAQGLLTCMVDVRDSHGCEATRL
jgi:hypothetical protein